MTVRRQAAALALLSSFVPQLALAATDPPDHVRLENYWFAPDGDNYAPALERVQVEETKRASTLLKASGPTVLLDCAKTYPLATTVRICAPLHVVGCGMDSSAFATTAPITPFEDHAESKCPFPIPNGDKAKGNLTLEQLAVLDWRFNDPTPRTGIDVRWTTELHSVRVRGFVFGIQLHAKASQPNPAIEVSNTNLSILDNVWVSDARGPGLLFGDPGGANTADTNVVHTNGGSYAGNCQAGTKWAPFLRPTKYCTDNPAEAVCTDPSMGCAGVFDVSFLGGQFNAPHTSNNKDLTTLQKFAGYVSVGDSNRSVWIAPYSESFLCTGSCETPGGGNYMGPQVMVIGGHSNWVGPGTWLHGNQVNTLVAVNTKDPANVVQMSLGAPNRAGAFQEWRAYADSASSAWSSSYTNAGRWSGWYTELFKSNTALTGVLHSGDKTKVNGGTIAPLGSIALPSRLYVDTGTTLVREGRGLSTALPVLDGTWPDGSTWRRTGTSSAGAVVLYEAQTVATKRKWVPIARRP